MSDETLVYDDDCGFCTWWAQFFKNRSAIRIVGFSELSNEERSRLPDEYENCAHFITDGGVYSCGAAMEQTFVRSAFGDRIRPLVAFLRNFTDYNSTREGFYREIAARRDTWGIFLSKDPPTRKTHESGTRGRSRSKDTENGS